MFCYLLFSFRCIGVIVNDLIALQALWLCDHDLDKITNFSSDFSVVAVSAMTEKVQQGFLHRRPFGGLAIFARISRS